MSFVESSDASIDLLIADYQLNENENGLELCRLLQERMAREIPIIIITGNTDAETIRHMEQNKITLLHKPVFPPQLRLTIENCLNTDSI